MPNAAFNGTFNIAANGIQEIQIPWNANIHISNGESSNETVTQILKKSIHIKVDPGKAPVVAYAQQWAGARSCATLLLPTNVLGKKYYAVSFAQNGSNQGSYNARSQFQIIATTDNTNVTITPRKNGVLGTPFTVNLPLAGDMIQYQSPDANAASQDLTGTLIESVASGGGGCLPIAVFSGSSNNTFGVAPSCSGTSYDPLWQQCYPVSSWGKNFGFVPFQQYPNGNPYRVMASEDNTTVSFNGVVVATLNKGEIYPAAYTSSPVVLTAPTSITADKPISVIQYAQADACTGQTGGGRVGDPDMVILNPIEQNIKDVVVFSSGRQAITRQWINVLLPSVDTVNFTINGSRPTTSWQLFTALPGYSYLRHLLGGPGSYRLKSDSGFNAIAYGWGNVESYAYSAGTNVIDLSQQLEIQTQYGIETTPSVCTNAPFQFKVYFPHYNNASPPQHIPFDSLDWDLTNRNIIVPNNFMIRQNSPTPVMPDSTTTVNGKLVDWYSLPGYYYFNTAGKDTLLITGYKSTNEGCGNTQVYPFEIVITDPPNGSFSWTGGTCPADTVKFTETTPQTPKATYHFWWDFGDPASGALNTSNLRNPKHVFTGPGTYHVRYASITTSGCLSDTITNDIVIPDFPNANIAIDLTNVCINDPGPTITFTGSLGTPEYYFTYTVDNGSGPGAPITVGPSAANVLILHPPTTVAGTYTYKLVSVRNTSTSLCTTNITGQQVTFTVTPDATIALTSANASQTVCINTAIDTIRYSIGGSGNGAFISSGTVPPGVSGTYAGGIFKVFGTPTVAGTYNFWVKTQGPCKQDSLAITINVTADATISWDATSGNQNQTVCENIAIAPIKYNIGGSGTGAILAGGSFPPGVTGSYAGGVYTILGTPTTPGTYNYKIKTTGPCKQDSISGTITVQQNSSLTWDNTSGNANQTVCVNTPISDIRYTVAGGGTGVILFSGSLPPGVTWNYTGPTLTIQGTPTTPGTYNFTFQTQGPCVNPQQAFVLTVTPDATISWDATSGNQNQTVCENVAIAPIRYTINGSGNGAILAGGSFPPGVTGSYSGGVYTILGTPTTPGTYNFKIKTTGPCKQDSLSGSIVVDANSTITWDNATGNPIQTVCVNTVLPTIKYNIAGGGTGVVVFSGGFPPGVTGTYAAGVYTIQGTPTAAGVYPFTLQTQGPCVNPTVSGQITVTGDASISWNNASGDTTQAVCKNTAITPIQIIVGGTGNGAIISSGSLPAGITGTYAGGVFTIQGTPVVSGVFPYYVKTTGPCKQDSLHGTITVWALPTADFTFTNPSCDTRLITFTDATTPNSGVVNSWNWNFNDGPGSTATTNPAYHTFSSTGTFNVSLDVQTDVGCTGTVTHPVTIHNRPQTGFIVPEVCINDVATTFTDTSHLTAPDTFDNAGYFWNFGDPASGPLNTSTSKNGVHLYTATGVYHVTHVSTSNFGCKDTLVQDITINGANPVADFSVGNPTTLCANDSVAITNLSSVNFGNVTKLDIIWDFVNQPAVVYTDDNPFFGKVYKHLYPNFQAPLTKNFTIRVRAYSGTICFNDLSKVITVNAAPKVQFNPIPNTCYLVPPFQITQASEVGGVPGSGVFSGPGITPGGIFSPQVAGIGTHTIKYTYTSTAAGCVDTLSQTITVLDTAHAVFSNQSPICEGDPASFTDNSTAPASVTLANTVWDFGDGTILENHAPGSTFTHTFATPGTFLVKMFNVSTSGCNSTTFSKPVTVDPKHHITLNSANNVQTLCVNANIADIIYTLSGGATGVTVTGLPAGVTFTVTGNQVKITGAPGSAAGSPYNYTVTTTGNTCTVDQATGIITVNPDHTIALTSAPKSDTQSVCVNTALVDIEYTLGGGANNATVTGLPAGVTYNVSGNKLTISGTPTPVTGGVFPYTVLTSGNACVKAQAQGQISVNPYPVPAFSVDKSSYCIPNAVVKFTNNSTLSGGTLSDMTFVWDFGDATGTFNQVHPVHQFTSTGPFNVKLTARSTVALTPSGIGCSSETIVVLNTIHPQPKADFTTDQPSVCQFQSATFRDNSDGKDGIVNEWHWNMGDGTPYLVNPVTHTYADTATYNVTYYVVNSIGCNSDTIVKTFTVYPYPHVNAGPDRYVLEGGTIILEPDVFANDPQYLWTPNQYLIDNKIKNVKVDKPQTDMTYTLTVTARGGCKASDVVFVKLLKFPVIPNTFTPNNDGINDTWRIDYLNTYPDNHVQVFTRSGQLVFESRGYNKPWDGTLKGKPLPLDTYYYIIEPGNGRDPITGYVTIIK
ncbi:MAG: PKD domain-containing protein [Ferruginibacter sp.]